MDIFSYHEYTIRVDHNLNYMFRLCIKRIYNPRTKKKRFLL